MTKKTRSILLMIILILSLSIGFALLSTTLNINGLAFITPQTWDIHWENVNNEGGVLPVSSATIDVNDNKKVDFEADFTIPGDYYEFEIDAVNRGTIDGMLKEIKATINGDSIDDLDDYLGYTITYKDGTTPHANDLLAVGKKTTYKVKLEYKRTITNEQLEALPNNGEPFEGSVEIIYIQSDNNATDPGNTVSLPEAFSTDDWTAIAAEGNNAARQSEVSNNACGVYHIGDTKEVDMGSLGVHTVRIANCSTPAVCSTSGFSQTACGFVLEFTDILTTRIMNPYPPVTDYSTIGTGNNGSWEYSDMRAYLNSGKYLEGTQDEVNYATTGIYNKLPKALKNAITTTSVVSGYGQYGNSHGNYTSTDKLYLLDAKELYGSTFSAGPAASSERQLDYYESEGVNCTNNFSGAIKRLNGTAKEWWIRSAYVGDYYAFYSIYTQGMWGITRCDYTNNNVSYGVSPAFKLK